MSSIEKLNVKISGQGSPTLVFVHGYGCDQTMWRFVAPEFQPAHRIITYDLIGMGQSDHSAYDFRRYQSLGAHAEDLGEILKETNTDDAVLVGHSVGATIACLASQQFGRRIKALALVAPSPCFVNLPDYQGGFERENLNGLIDVMEQNFLGWTDQVTPIISGQPEDGSVTTELTQSFCRTDPAIAKHFGKVTFLADHREEMAQVTLPSLVLQCSDDALAPTNVGEWLAEHMANGDLRVIEATGHCPHLTEPKQTVRELRRFLDNLG